MSTLAFLLTLKTLLLGIVGLVVMIAYSLLLIHVLRGNKNKWVILQSVMMILSGAFYLPYSYGYVKFYL